MRLDQRKGEIMELVEANAIELLGKGTLMICREDYNHRGLFLSRSSATDCCVLKARVGRVLIIWIDGIEYSYSGEYIVHWA